MILNQLTVFFLDTELDDHFYDLAVSNAEKHLIFGPWLSAWETAFTNYLSHNQAQLGDEDRRAAMVLKAHHLVADILTSVDLSMGELGWDVFHDKVSIDAIPGKWTRETDTVTCSLEPLSSLQRPSCKEPHRAVRPPSRHAGRRTAYSFLRHRRRSPSALGLSIRCMKWLRVVETLHFDGVLWISWQSTLDRNACGVHGALGRSANSSCAWKRKHVRPCRGAPLTS